MKLTYNWLKDFVEIKIPARVLADKLTMAGLEVTSLEEKDGDFIIEIEITSNRPDWLSVIGIAREVAALTGKKVKLLRATSYLPAGRQACLSGRQASLRATQPQSLSLEITDKKDCPLYTVKIIRDVQVGPSPEWLKQRLELIGCRSVNNIVDVTNYILFTYGEPLHAFDLDKLREKSILVRRAKDQEKITAIDGKEKILDSGILVITDGYKPVAIAGVMGGLDSEVTVSTKNILLEAAIFNPLLIRRSRQKLGLQTDSSYRFERGIAPETVESASLAAVALIQELSGGKCVLCKNSAIAKSKKTVISLDADRVNRILGANIALGKIKIILSALGFSVGTIKKNVLSVRVPGYRQDVSLEIDLVEEIARIAGFDRAPVSLPCTRAPLSENSARGLVALIKNILVGQGSSEVITYSLIERSSLEGLPWLEKSPVEIQNPLTKEQEILRPTLIPSLAKCLAYNLNQKQSYLNIFEVAKVFSAGNTTLPCEELTLGLALCGEKTQILESGRIREKVGVLHLKGILEILLLRLGINNYSFQSDAPGKIVLLIEGERVGFFAKLPAALLSRLDIKNNEVAIGEIELEKIFSHVNLKKKYVAIAQFPGISRDISLVLKEGIALAQVFAFIREKAGPLLEEIKVVDYYQGKQIPAGSRGLTISCLYRSLERTLTESEINPLQTALIQELTAKFSASTR